MKEFSGKVAVVTGGASGIGLALARRLGAEGMSVVVADIEGPALARAVDELRRSGVDALGVRADVSRRPDVEAIASAAMEAHGAVHLVCNNAGVGVGGLSWEMSSSDWEWVLGVDLWGVIHGIGVFTPLIIASGGGHIVNTASMAGLTAMPFIAAYNVAKHGVVALSETLFHELALTNPEVGVTVVCPGWVQTQINRSERNRPEDAGPALAVAGSDDLPADLGRQVADMIDGLIADGLTPDSVADQIVEAVNEGRFYVLTHPEWSGEVLRRTERMLAGENPKMIVPGNG